MLDFPPRSALARAAALLLLAATAAHAQGPLPGPEPNPEAVLGPNLKTIPVARNAPLRNLIVVDPTLLPRDQIARRNGVGNGLAVEALPPELQKFWVLDFAFKPVRIQEVETPKGRKSFFYLYYRVINKTGKPRMFVPQFTLVTDEGKARDETVMPRAVAEVQRRETPKAVRAIQAREDIAVPLLGAVDMIGYIPPSGQKVGVDDAVFGVALWELDPEIAKADAFKIYVKGLSDGAYPEKKPDGSVVHRYKTLRIDFTCPGDHIDKKESEIRLLDPPLRLGVPRAPQALEADRGGRPAYLIGSSSPSPANAESLIPHESQRPQASPSAVGS